VPVGVFFEAAEEESDRIPGRAGSAGQSSSSSELYPIEWRAVVPIRNGMKERTSKQIRHIMKAVFAVLSVGVVGAEGELADPDAGAVMQMLSSVWLFAGAVWYWRARRRAIFDLAKHGLTPREIDFTRQLLGGKAPKEIAIDCKVEYSTVRDAMSRVYKKLGIAGARQLFEIGATHEVV